MYDFRKKQTHCFNFQDQYGSANGFCKTLQKRFEKKAWFTYSWAQYILGQCWLKPSFSWNLPYIFISQLKYRSKIVFTQNILKRYIIMAEVSGSLFRLGPVQISYLLLYKYDPVWKASCDKNLYQTSYIKILLFIRGTRIKIKCLYYKLYVI